jgi:hypothetical protein
MSEVKDRQPSLLVRGGLTILENVEGGATGTRRRETGEMGAADGMREAMAGGKESDSSRSCDGVRNTRVAQAWHARTWSLR